MPGFCDRRERRLESTRKLILYSDVRCFPIIEVTTRVNRNNKMKDNTNQNDLSSSSRANSKDSPSLSLSLPAASQSAIYLGRSSTLHPIHAQNWCISLPTPLHG